MSEIASDVPRACSPYDVGSKAQLFVDQLLVRETERVWFTQHQGTKHPDNPVLVADQPWEGYRLQVYGSVIYDEQEALFKMWYLTAPRPEEGYFDEPPTCYATSTDGVHWDKPLVGTLPSMNGEPHNAVTEYWLCNVFKEIDEPDPARRYKMICYQHGWPVFGYHTCVSPDGLNWTRLSKEPFTAGSNVLTAFWDPSRKLYVAFTKQQTQWRGFLRRLFYTVTSSDLANWSEPVLSFKTDARDDAGSLARIEQVRPILDRDDSPDLMRTEVYGVGAYAAESCTIGFPWMLTINNDSRGGNHEGPAEIQLAVSRDLLNWERPFRTPVIGFGELGQWDASYQTTSASAIRVGDEIRLYYAGANYTHGTPNKVTEPSLTSSIGLVTWPLDRFVSADAPAEGGTLTTIPIVFEGARLEINAATKQGGEVMVELCDAAGRPLESFGKSDAFSGDDLRHEVTFAGKKDVSALARQPVVLRFHLKNAELYSFAFRKCFCDKH